MLIGCCHCDEPSESLSSVPSEPSVSEPSISESSVPPSESSVSEPPVIGLCGVCYNLPVAWEFSMPTGFLDINDTVVPDPYSDCRDKFYGDVLLQSVPITDLTIAARVVLNMTDLSTVCAVWQSDERAPEIYEQIITPGNPPVLCPDGSFPRWELVARSLDANNPNGCSATYFTLFMWWNQGDIFLGGLVGYAWEFVFETTRDDQGNCVFRNCVMCRAAEYTPISWVVTLAYFINDFSDIIVCPA